MISPPRISLETWLKLTYGDDPHAPGIQAARRWCREGKLQAVKEGRSYFVSPDARYTEPAPTPVEDPAPESKLRLIHRIHAATPQAR